MTNQHPDTPPEPEVDEAQEEPTRQTQEGLGRPDLGEQRDTADRHGETDE